MTAKFCHAGAATTCLTRCLLRILAFSMILVLLSVRLGSFGEELFVTPVEDAIFDVAFVSVDDNGPQTKPAAIKYKGTLDCDLPQGDISVPGPVSINVVLSPYVPAWSPRDLVSDIFIPPEVSV